MLGKVVFVRKAYLLKNQDQVKAYIAVGIAVLLWASAFPGVKYSLVYYSPESLIAGMVITNIVRKKPIDSNIV